MHTQMNPTCPKEKHDSNTRYGRQSTAALPVALNSKVTGVCSVGQHIFMKRDDNEFHGGRQIVNSSTTLGNIAFLKEKNKTKKKQTHMNRFIFFICSRNRQSTAALPVAPNVKLQQKKSTSSI